MTLRPLLDADVIHERDNVLGEDTYDLFVEIEESFGVQLGDYGALCGITIAELAHEIFAKANYPDKDKCLSAAMFYRLRRALQELTVVPRSEIRPSTPVAELLPWRDRGALWKRLHEALGLSLPKLMLPRWLFFLCIATPAASLIYFKLHLPFTLNWFAIFTGWIALIVLALNAVSPWARELPHNTQTLGGLTKVILARNYGSLARGDCGSSEDDVLSALQQAIATALAMEVNEITPHTRVPQDLNIY